MIPKFKILNFESFLINIIYSGNAVSETSFIRFQNLRQINFYFIGHNLLLSCFPAWSAWYGYLSSTSVRINNNIPLPHLTGQYSTLTRINHYHPNHPNHPSISLRGSEWKQNSLNSSPRAVHTTATGCKEGSKSSFPMGIIAEYLRSTI